MYGKEGKERGSGEEKKVCFIGFGEWTPWARRGY